MFGLGTIPILSTEGVTSISYVVLKQISSVKLNSKRMKQDVPLYTKRDEHYKLSKKNTIKKLEELLNFRKNYAIEVVSKYKNLLEVPSYNIAENYHSCISQGISKTTLINHPEILGACDIPIKMEKLKRLKYDINITAPLLLLKLNVIEILLFESNEVDRIKILSSLFQVHEDEICMWMSKKPFLISFDIDTIEDRVRTLHGYGILKNEISGDLWVLRYSTEEIKRKLDIVKASNIDTLKTWMVRVTPEILENYIKRRSDNKLILGDNSLVEYISERLVCGEEIARYIISKHPALQKKSLKKFNEMIDFLFKYGYKPIHICRTPKILLHSIQTVKKRLKELEEQGTKLDTLHILTKSTKQYTQFCELHKGNKSKRYNYFSLNFTD